MPVCRRCERVQATAELRRTPLGYVCKDNGTWSRCASLTEELRAIDAPLRIDRRSAAA